MPATTTVYNAAKLRLGNAGFDLDGDTFKIMLLTSGYTLDENAIDTHDFRDDVTAFEATGTGYTAGGATLQAKTWTQDNTNNRAIWDFDNVTFTTLTTAFRFATIYKSLGGASSADPLVATIDYLSTQTITGQDLLITLDALGFIALRQAA